MQFNGGEEKGGPKVVHRRWLPLTYDINHQRLGVQVFHSQVFHHHHLVPRINLTAFTPSPLLPHTMAGLFPFGGEKIERSGLAKRVRTKVSLCSCANTLDHDSDPALSTRLMLENSENI